MKTEYSYVLLRYLHDASAGESLNVGVVVYAPEAPYLSARFTSKGQRVKDAFSSLDISSFKEILGYLRHAFERKAKAVNEFLDERGKPQQQDIAGIVRTILPEDDSSLQWSERRGGVTQSDFLDDLVDSLYERYIGRYEVSNVSNSLKEEDIWRMCRTGFLEANVESRLSPKSFHSDIADDEIVFEHAWKNGIWNCYEPVSFDLKKADSIRDKAWRMNGKVSDLKHLKDDLAVTFLLGEPRDSKLKKELTRAENRLLNTAVKVDIVRQSELADWSKDVAAKISAAG